MMIVIGTVLFILFVMGVGALVLGARDEQERREADEASHKTKESSEYVEENQIDKKV